MKYDVAVIGGGAAGLFCAATAGRRGRKVLVIEHSERVGEKIKISGGGRCNFTNIHAGADNYISGNPSFCRSALARFSPWDFIALVEKHGIPFHEKTLGQQFCNGSSREIIAMLLAECARVEIRCGCKVEDVQPGYRLRTSSGEISCDSLVIATGGLSFAKLGASDFGHRIAKQFGMRVTGLRPGLVPLTLKDVDLRTYSTLSGLSFPVRVKSRAGASFEEALLITHRGFSGPAILQISSYWNAGEQLSIDLLPGGNPLPRRFAEKWKQFHSPQKPESQWSLLERDKFDALLHNWPVEIAGTEGYSKAEVTLGGVDTGDLSSKTMESRTQRGLYFIGEVVDVTGWLGGYNFQWAWASAHAAGEVV